jgi:hypothetical protein
LVSANEQTSIVTYRAPSQLAAGAFITPTFVLNRTANGTGSLTVTFNPGGGGVSDSETLAFA